MIRVAILGGNAMIRAGLGAVLSAEPDLEPVEADEGCDVLLLSGTPGPGRTFFEEPSTPETVPAAVLVIADEVEPYRSVLERVHGAFGLLPLSASAGEIRTAIRALAAGMLAGSPRLMRSLFDGAPDDKDGFRVGGELSPRETEVLHLLSLGLVNKEIAARLQISEHTVKYHISSIFTKLEATNRVEAIREGIRRGLLEL